MVAEPEADVYSRGSKKHKTWRCKTAQSISIILLNDGKNCGKVTDDEAILMAEDVGRSEIQKEQEEDF